MAAGALELYRRHLRDCAHLPNGNGWMRCHCPIWVQGSIAGERIRRSLNTTNWTSATATIQGWQVTGQIGVLKPDVPSIADAITKCLDEAAARQRAATTIRKRRELLVGKLLPYCKSHGCRQLRQLTVAFSWPVSGVSSIPTALTRVRRRSPVQVAWSDR